MERRLEVGGGSLYGCSVAESGVRAPSPWLLLAGLAMGAARLRRRRWVGPPGRTRVAALVAGLCAAGVAFPAPPARAQAQSEPPSRFVPQRFEPAATRSAGYFALPGARSLGAGFYDLGVVLDHADDVLVVRDAASGERIGAIVGDQLRAHLIAAVGLTDWLDLGVGLPVYLGQSGDALADVPGPSAGDAGVGVGDLRVVPRLRLAGAPEGPGTALALLVSVWAPTGRRADFRGEGFRLRPSLILEHSARSGLRVAFEAGYLVRDQARLLELRVDDTVELGAALAVPLGAGARVEALVELQSALSVHAAGEAQMPLELLAGARWHVSEAVHIDIGTGIGVVGGFGAPDWRLLGGISFTRPRVHDLDGDGVRDEADVCVAAPEDFDGFEDLDGCPDIDNDGDTVPDTLDGPAGPDGFGSCRDRAEDFDGFEDDDGCPDDDNDRDGIPDDDDECPADTEDIDLFEDDDGCPELDNDRDGIPDVDDQCPSDPAPAGGDGCP